MGRSEQPPVGAIDVALHVLPTASTSMTVGPSGEGTRKSAVDAAMYRYTRTRDRLDAGVAGRARRRIGEVDLSNQALILAALAFMAIVPVLISLAALVPLGDSQTGEVAQRLGLSPEATRDLQQLMPARAQVIGSTTIFGVLLAVVSAFSWPTALQRGYEMVWGLPSLGWRVLWRPLLWLATVLVVGALAGGSAPLITEGIRVLLLVVIGVPVAVGWAWWTQHMLLAGRMGWRPLLPGAILIGLGLIGTRLLAGLFLSSSITHHFEQYGPLGIVFIILSWLVAFSTVMLGGALLGAVWVEHRRRQHDTT